MKVKDVLIRVLKKTYRKAVNKKFNNPNCDCNRLSSNDKIYKLLSDNKPCLISRFGTTEINTINNYVVISSNKSRLKKNWDYITDKTHTPWWNEDHLKFLDIYSGIFPPTKETARKFSERYLHDIPEIDLLGSHQYYEKFMPLKEDIVNVHLEMLYPFFVSNPWTKILKGKKVLVIHPFEDSIKSQYNKRHLLFEDSNILPDFDLITYKAVQSVGGNKVPYKDWFEALQKMEDDISEIDFDIALLGCGAYGLPLGAHIKRLGKKAVHIGGGLQLMFGILGKRWVEQYDNILEYHTITKNIIDINYRKLFNINWIYPLDSDVPSNAEKVENSCYWK